MGSTSVEGLATAAKGAPRLHDWVGGNFRRFGRLCRNKELHSLQHTIGRVWNQSDATGSAPGFWKILIATEPIAAEIEAADIVYADETSWPESSDLLWLWAFVSQYAVLFVIGLRTSEMIDNVLGLAFKGKLMTDGYQVYRKFMNRLRCWAHLSRKLRGLAESTDAHAGKLGGQLLALFLKLQNAIYAARAGPDEALPSVKYAVEIAAFKALCEQLKSRGGCPVTMRVRAGNQPLQVQN